ncbi:hypothetical protein RUND412_006241 [Rhizina undulata]
MENPVKEISSIIHGLTVDGAPAHQRLILETFFTSDVGFEHPICHIGRFSTPLESRTLLLAIYRWYKHLSYAIKLDVNSIAFDEPKRRLYLDITQDFTFWFFPWYHIHADLVSVLQLRRVNEKWFISQQSDLYQTEQWMQFWFPGSWTVVVIIKRLAALGCVLSGSVVMLLGMLWEAAVGGHLAHPAAKNHVLQFRGLGEEDKVEELITSEERKSYTFVGKSEK